MIIGLNRMLVLVFTAVIFGSFNCRAAIVSLAPENQTIGIGEDAVLQLSVDFTGEETLGGGIDVFFDNFTNGNGLTFVSYVPETLGEDFARRVPDVLDNELNGIAFGDFGGITGVNLVGTLTFRGDSPGLYNLTLAENDAPAGGFRPSPGPNFTLNGAQINVVPIPAAFWMMFGGVGILVGLRKNH